MKYYSETLKKLFDSKEECLKAEFIAKREEEEKKFQAKKAIEAAKKKLDEEKEAARKEIEEAINHASELLIAYMKKYEGDSPFAKFFLDEIQKGNNNNKSIYSYNVKKKDNNFNNLISDFLN